MSSSAAGLTTKVAPYVRRYRLLAVAAGGRRAGADRAAGPISDDRPDRGLAQRRDRPTATRRWCWRTARYSGAAASARPASAVGEVCFNTSMTGYQEILTDPPMPGRSSPSPSRISAMSAPTRGHRDRRPRRRAAWSSAAPTHRAVELARRRSSSTPGCKSHGIVGIAGVDTRRLTRLHPRPRRAQRGHRLRARRQARHRRAARRGARPGRGSKAWTSPRRSPAARATTGTRRSGQREPAMAGRTAPRFHVVAVDYGAKRNILRMLAEHGCRVTVVPATATAEDILRHKPDGIFLSNGPGDPAATGEYAVPVIARADRDRQADVRHLPRPPDAGAGARRPDPQDGHRPSRRQPPGARTWPPARSRSPARTTASSSIPTACPTGVEATHVSLFDGTNEGLRLEGQAGLLGAVPPRGQPRPAGQPLPVRALRRLDGERPK